MPLTAYQKFARAFEIFASYREDLEGVAADHYFLHAGPDPAKVSAEHRDELELLGWLQNDDTFSYTL